MDDDDDWISADETYKLVSAQVSPFKAASAICTRAHAGLLRAHADRLTRDRESLDDVDIPKSFWWAEGERALEQNWVTGDFETTIEGRYKAKAFGVKFHRDDLRKMLPAVPRLSALAPMMSGAAALQVLTEACGDAEEAARTLFRHSRVGGLKTGARFLRTEDEDGEASVEESRRLKVEDWKGIEEPSAADLTKGNLRGSYRDPVERMTIQVELVGLQFDPEGVRKLAASIMPVPASESDPAPSPRNPGGRPLAGWWDDLLIEMFRRLWEDDWAPRTQSEVVEAMQIWLVENPGPDPAKPRDASESTLKLRAKKLFEVLELGQKLP